MIQNVLAYYFVCSMEQKVVKSMDYEDHSVVVSDVDDHGVFLSYVVMIFLLKNRFS